MDIREVSGVKERYFEINREERYYCASLYALLIQKNDNLKNFTSYLNSKMSTQDQVDINKSEEFEIYVEHSYPRDIWEHSGKNEKKLELICQALNIASIKELSRKSPLEFNRVMVGFGGPSGEYIQNPGTWSISKYAINFNNDTQGNVDFL